METIKLPEKWVTHLKNQKETGMGYQIVRVDLKNGRFFKSVAFNCEELAGILPFDTTVEDISNITVE